MKKNDVKVDLNEDSVLCWKGAVILVVLGIATTLCGALIVKDIIGIEEPNKRNVEVKSEKPSERFPL